MKHIDEFAKLLIAGKRPECELSTEKINAECEKYKNVFLLWDGAFSYARKTNPQEADFKAYSYFVKAAFASHQAIGCSVTHKVHLMIDHVEWQMRNLEGGLGGKLEDWVEKDHQDGARRRAQFRTARDQDRRAKASEKAAWRSSDAGVQQCINEVRESFTRQLSTSRITKAEESKETRHKNRVLALQHFHQSLQEGNLDNEEASWVQSQLCDNTVS